MVVGKTLSDLKEYYDLELSKVVLEIKKENAKLVLIQFPDGLKIYATAVVDYLQEQTDAEFLIYLGQCFGACDYPVDVDNLGIDLIVQFGHSDLMPTYI